MPHHSRELNSYTIVIIETDVTGRCKLPLRTLLKASFAEARTV